VEWAKEAFHFGAPCPVFPPGRDGIGEVMGELERPFGKIHFVGTETTRVWRGYMEGAVRSGKRGANEVLEALGRCS
jgi:monoamine oxidase